MCNAQLCHISSDKIVILHRKANNESLYVHTTILYGTYIFNSLHCQSERPNDGRKKNYGHSGKPFRIEANVYIEQCGGMRAHQATEKAKL